MSKHELINLLDSELFGLDDLAALSGGEINAVDAIEVVCPARYMLNRPEHYLGRIKALSISLFDVSVDQRASLVKEALLARGLLSEQ